MSQATLLPPRVRTDRMLALLADVFGKRCTHRPDDESCVEILDAATRCQHCGVELSAQARAQCARVRIMRHMGFQRPMGVSRFDDESLVHSPASTADAPHDGHGSITAQRSPSLVPDGPADEPLNIDAIAFMTLTTQVNDLLRRAAALERKARARGLTRVVEFATRNESVVAAGRDMFEAFRNENAAIEVLERVRRNGFTDEYELHANAVAKLERTRTDLEKAILDFSETMRQAHALEPVEVTA